MAYAKKTWSDRVVERPLTYTLQTNSDGSTTLIPAEGSVIAAGTALTADALNNMETGIANSVERAGDAMTGNLTVPNLYATTKVYEANVALSDKYYPKTGGALTGDVTAPNVYATTKVYEAGVSLVDKYSLNPIGQNLVYSNMSLYNGWTAAAGLTPQFCDLKNGYMHLVGTFIAGGTNTNTIVVHLPIQYHARKVMRVPVQWGSSAGHFLLQDEAGGYPTLYWGGQVVGTNPVTLNAIVPIGYA